MAHISNTEIFHQSATETELSKIEEFNHTNTKRTCPKSMPQYSTKMEIHDMGTAIA